MIKIFWGGRGGDTFKTPSPYEQLLPLPTPYFKMFLERSLNDPPPPITPLQASFTATPPPHPSTTPSPHPKNFDHTLDYLVVTLINTDTEILPKFFSWLISRKVYLPVSKFSSRLIKSEINNGRSKAGVVNMSTPLNLVGFWFLLVDTHVSASLFFTISS